MLEGKGIVSETDMTEEMQCQVMELAYQALDLHEVSDFQSMAHFIKQVLLLTCIYTKGRLLTVALLCNLFFYFTPCRRHKSKVKGECKREKKRI